MTIHPEIAALPIGHLSLSKRARSTAASFGSIGGLLAAWTRSREGLGTPPVARELDLVLENLSKMIRQNGMTGWDKVRRSRPLRKDWKGMCSVYFMSPALRRLTPAVSQKPLAELHLNVRSINALEAIGIKTIGELAERARLGVPHFPAAGGLTSAEIRAALEALSTTTTPNGNINWIRYAQARGFTIIPQAQKKNWSGFKFLQHLPDALRRAVYLQYGSRSLRVLEERFLADPGDRPSLKKLGKRFGRTGERARLIEEKFIKLLRRAIWLDDYRGCKFRFRPEFLEPLRKLAARLESEGTRVFSLDEWDDIFTHTNCSFNLQPEVLKKLHTAHAKRRDTHLLFSSQWDRLLHELWGLRQEDLNHKDRLILGILGFRSLSYNRKSSSSIVLLKNRKSAAIRKSAKEIERLLTLSHAKGLSGSDLLKALRKQMGRDAPTLAEISNIVRATPSLERTADGSYRARLSCLKYYKNKFERILREEKKPLHYRDIIAKAGITRKSNDERGVPALSAQPCFVPIGKSGFWALSEWGVESRKIADVAAEVANRMKKPITEAEIFDFVSAQRPCSKRSIYSLLRCDKRFRRVGPSTWTLAKQAVPAT